MNARLRSGTGEVSIAARQLRVDGEKVKLGARAFRCVAGLIERRARIVAKNELKYPSALLTRFRLW